MFEQEEHLIVFGRDEYNRLVGETFELRRENAELKRRDRVRADLLAAVVEELVWERRRWTLRRTA
jgi:hypothetical protein